MDKRLIVPAALAGLMMVAGLAANAEAAQQGGVDPEAAAVSDLKVPLTQAITIAEQHTGGKAYDAGISLDQGKMQIVVETNGPAGVKTVMIDPQSGAVLGERVGSEQD